mmetsp:Transcript_22871/g.60417  ORF Transcript_22871/g.60417 Transcript_22871/m.60417 type:complete len:251 (+) Transcript_22871:100-852(+)
MRVDRLSRAPRRPSAAHAVGPLSLRRDGLLHLLLHPLLHRLRLEGIPVLLVTILVASERTEESAVGARLLHEHEDVLPPEALGHELHDWIGAVPAAETHDHRRRGRRQGLAELGQRVLELSLGRELHHGGATRPLHVLDDLVHRAALRRQLQNPLAVAEPDDRRVAVYAQLLRRGRVRLGVQRGEGGAALGLQLPRRRLEVWCELHTMRAARREEVHQNTLLVGLDVILEGCVRELGHDGGGRRRRLGEE